MTRIDSESEYDMELRIPDTCVLVRFFFADGSYLDVAVEDDESKALSFEKSRALDKKGRLEQ